MSKILLHTATLSAVWGIKFRRVPNFLVYIFSACAAALLKGCFNSAVSDNEEGYSISPALSLLCHWTSGVCSMICTVWLDPWFGSGSSSLLVREVLLWGSLLQLEPEGSEGRFLGRPVAAVCSSALSALSRRRLLLFRLSWGGLR